MNKKNTKRGRGKDLEAKLDRGIKALLGRGPEDYTADQWRGLREQLRLDILYPGQYVAYRDHYDGEYGSRRLVRREVLDTSRSLRALQKRFVRLPQEEQQEVWISYIEPEEELPQIG